MGIRRRLCGALSFACLLVLVSLGCRGLLQTADAAETPPRLVLVLVIDQLRPERLTAELPGGLGRLVREGRLFESAALAHAYTETCPGHAVILTGRHPGAAGIPSNSFVEKASMKLRYCVDDPSEDATTFGGTGSGRSPRNLRSTALGDWMKAQDPRSRVFVVAGKDRAAIMLGGQRPDGVYWLDWRGRGAFTTSRYYTPTLPDWVDRWKRDKILDGLPTQWVHESGDPPNGVRKDAFPGETTRYSNASPHPMPAPLPDLAVGTSEDETEIAAQKADMDTTLAKLYFTPFLDTVTLRFAKELIETESLGSRDATDLLAIGLSATDLVGHLYGPWSQESRDALLRLDAALGEFLAFLDRRIGKDRVLVALTADHGVLPLPEALAAEGHASCPIEKGRLSPTVLIVELRAHLVERFGQLPKRLAGAKAVSTPTSRGMAPGWVMREGHRLTVNRPLAAEKNVEVEAIVAAASEFLSRQTGIAKVWRPEEFAKSSDPKAALYRNSHDPERGGDLVLELAPGCLLSDNPYGTTHGSPHDYDRKVPMLFAGPGVKRARVAEPVASVDIGPTLADQIGVRAPPGLDGRVLQLNP